MSLHDFFNLHQATVIMKKGIVYILLLSYSTLMLKPVLPYISDSIAHIFWYSKHMATVHYIDGKFHVHKAVMEEEKRNGADKNPFTEKKDQSQYEYLITLIKPLIFKGIIVNNYFAKPSTPLFTAYLKKDYPPPRLSEL
ncbi:MAG: hypothetical protein ABI402_16345 [Ferruginibacter sp.]